MGIHHRVPEPDLTSGAGPPLVLHQKGPAPARSPSIRPLLVVFTPPTRGWVADDIVNRFISSYWGEIADSSKCSSPIGSPSPLRNRSDLKDPPWSPAQTGWAGNRILCPGLTIPRSKTPSGGRLHHSGPLRRRSTILAETPLTNVIAPVSVRSDFNCVPHEMGEMKVSASTSVVNLGSITR